MFELRNICKTKLEQQYIMTFTHIWSFPISPFMNSHALSHLCTTRSTMCSSTVTWKMDEKSRDSILEELRPTKSGAASFIWQYLRQNATIDLGNGCPFMTHCIAKLGADKGTHTYSYQRFWLKWQTKEE